MRGRVSSPNMAALFLTVGRTALKGVPGRWLLTQTPAVCRCPPLHVSLCSSRTDTHRNTHNTADTHRNTHNTADTHRSTHNTADTHRNTHNTADTHRNTHNTADTHAGDRRAEEEDDDDGPEYIPKKKAKNPMMKIGYAWMIGLPTGIIGFLLAKREVDKNRLKQLKVRQRMRRSNEGDYERSRYRHQAEDVKLDQ